MKNILLSFSDSSLEKKYLDYCVAKNKSPAFRLLIFNITFLLSLGFVGIIFEKNVFFIMCFCNIFMIILLYGVLIHFKFISKYLPSQYVYVYFTILASLITLSVFLINDLPSLKSQINGARFDYIDSFVLGFCFKMYVSHIYLFNINWIMVSILKCLVCIYIICMKIMENQNAYTFQNGLIMILTLMSLFFDFKKEKNDRKNFLNEYFLNKHYANFKEILENLPDQVLIYQKKGLVFANESSFELFKAKNLKEINDNINKNFEFQNIGIETSHEELFLSPLKPVLWKKIEKLLHSKNETQTFVANELKAGGSINHDIEYDVVLKKILWENESSIMVLFSKVNEKNMKARLNFVNSFLTLVLGSVSHEINTPIHVIQGNLENLKQKFNDPPYELKIIKRFMEFLNIMMEIMIDLFNIRKGDLYLNVSKIQTKKFFKEIITIFEECFPYKKIRFCLKNVPNMLNTDYKRMKNIFIFILNKLFQKMEEGEIEISFVSIESSCCNFYKIFLSCRGKIKFNETRGIEEDFSPKNSNWSSPLTNRKNRSIAHQKNDFYLINPLILSFSCGSCEILDEEPLPEPSFENPQPMIYSFRISDFGNHETLNLQDPFREKNHFCLHFIYSEDKDFQKSNDNIIISEILLSSQIGLDFRRKLKILNVDDMLFSLIVISNYCHKHKLFVEEAKNGLEACKAVENLFQEEEKAFDLIFMDIDMPIMNGLEASKKINDFLEEKKMKKSIILAITANASNKELIESCESNGITEVFKKPLSLENFEEIIKKYLHSRNI